MFEAMVRDAAPNLFLPNPHRPAGGRALAIQPFWNFKVDTPKIHVTTALLPTHMKFQPTYFGHVTLWEVPLPKN